MGDILEIHWLGPDGKVRAICVQAVGGMMDGSMGFAMLQKMLMEMGKVKIPDQNYLWEQ